MMDEDRVGTLDQAAVKELGRETARFVFSR
jgi:hypothetical protein